MNNETLKAKIIDCYQQGASIFKTAEMTGTSEHLVRKVLQEANVIRSRSEGITMGIKKSKKTQDHDRYSMIENKEARPYMKAHKLLNVHYKKAALKGCQI